MKREWRVIGISSRIAHYFRVGSVSHIWFGEYIRAPRLKERALSFECIAGQRSGQVILRKVEDSYEHCIME